MIFFKTSNVNQEAVAGPEFVGYISIINDYNQNQEPYYIFDIAHSALPPRGAWSFGLNEKGALIGGDSNGIHEYKILQELFEKAKKVISYLQSYFYYPDLIIKLDYAYDDEKLLNLSNLPIIQARLLTVGSLARGEPSHQYPEVICETNYTDNILRSLNSDCVLRLMHKQQQTTVTNINPLEYPLNHIKGIRVPECFNRGILSHNDFIPVAYVLARNLPFEFYKEN
ncbi:MAG: hypothetical protein KatS3mg090_0116 [Patescibacteria group bacterium]|nr:MAG: hypothetical protein KatS3mg090_0116 [Patescibacteria group bacterium]